jgi:tRNA threonylcarbamoyladenosine biosynthesis protein TsaB
MSADGVLGLDTATADATVAVSVGGELVAERRAAPAPGGRPRHASMLAREVEGAVADAGGWEWIGSIAAGVGPGTFTGLRVGISTARALAQGHGLGVVGVGSLAALARGIGERDSRRLRLAVIDARRDEVFAALFDRSGAELWPPFVIAAEPLAERLAGLAKQPLAAGDGSLRFRQQLESAGVEVPADTDPVHRMAARHVCALAEGIAPGPPADLKPAYLRRPDAEIWREQRDRSTESG